MAISFQNFIDKKWSLRSQAYFLKPLVNKKKKSPFLLIQQNLFYICCLSAQAHFYDLKYNIKVFHVF